jgi:hypothetical protein
MSLLKRFAVHLRKLLPTPGNVVFTLVVAGSLILASRAGALSPNAPEAPTLSTNTIPYQGRIANSAGTPLTGNYEMTFALYSQLSGSTALWVEAWAGGNSVRISDGLFNVLLGSLQPIPQSVITGNNNLWLGVKVGSDAEMMPRLQLGSVPFATQALTVPDGSITKAKLASDVNLVPPAGSVTTTMMADGSITSQKLKLPSGTVCLTGAHRSVTLPGSYTAVDVPSLSMNFALERPSKVLIWADGLALSSFVGAEFLAHLVLDGGLVGGSLHVPLSGSSQWLNIKTQRIIAVTSGNHTIKLQVIAHTLKTEMC